ncbi:MAG: hypothetical protein M1819_005634 [Sarea resinae]|nr:MAG: hypothetical protein M1819_005634 [Sarea resinae]
MPRKYSNAGPSTKRAKLSKGSKSRSLDAFAIASQQNPDRVKVRQHRLGESEGELGRRKKKSRDDNDGEDDEEEDSRVRNDGRKSNARGRANELDVDEGSDSEGNEWRLGQVDDDDDSDIDSDEAMGESDEEQFEDFRFRGSSGSKMVNPRSKALKTKNVKSSSHELDLDESEDEDGQGSADSDDDSLGEDAIDLAAMLDATEEEEPVQKNPKKRKASWQDEENAADSSNGEDGSDSSSESEENESILSFSEDGDDNDPEKLSALQSLISSMQANSEGPLSKRQRTSDPHESSAPSDFGVNVSQKLTVADLLPSVTDARLKKSLKILSSDKDPKSSAKRQGVPGKLDVPLAKRQQDQLDRAAAYDKSKETLERWIETVKHNRRAEHLTFPLADPGAVAAHGRNNVMLNSGSTPLNELESAIQNILEESGMKSAPGKSEEDKIRAFEELQTNKLPLEEVQGRRAELRKARELLFREEVRAKRIKKIKSKAYRRVHRKQREREEQEERDAFAAAGVELSEDEKERNDRRRAEERMRSRHRESKWAKEMKKSGRAVWDEDSRSGATEMARRGEELRRRMEGKSVQNDETGSDLNASEESDSDPSSDDEQEDREARLLRKLAESGSLNPSEKEPGSKLASMKFMQKAEASRKIQNDADAERLRRELAGEDPLSEAEEAEFTGRKTFGPTTKTMSRPSQKEIHNEFEERQGSDDEHHEETIVDREDDIDIIVDSKELPGQSHTTTKSGKNRKHANGKKDAAKDTDQDVFENPWLNNTGNSSHKEKSSKRNGAVALKETNQQDDFDNDPMVSLHPSAKPKSNVLSSGVDQWQSVYTGPDRNGHDSDDSDEGDDLMPFVLRNQELVKKAFAGDDVVADFEEEKKQTIQDEDEKVIDNTLPGWGSWTGDGVSKGDRKRNKGRFLTKVEGIKESQRKDSKLDRVIINEKRVKKNSKYLASNLPHPFETRQQYERSLRLPVGPEWTTKETFQNATKPRVMVKRGVVAPMERPSI